MQKGEDVARGLRPLRTMAFDLLAQPPIHLQRSAPARPQEQRWWAAG